MWQFSRVFDGETIFEKKLTFSTEEDIKLICSDSNGNPTEQWCEFNKLGSEAKPPYRFPYIGKPLYYYCKNENGEIGRLGWAEFRKKSYIPE